MEAPASPLILTKLRVPAPRPHNLPRTHLIERLNPGTGTHLILVCAPAGYGKTTLLSEWAQDRRHKGMAVSWLSLDASDDVPNLFGTYLIASLAQALGPTSELSRLTQLLRTSPELDLQKILPAVINAIDSSDRDCVLILDDYHLIASPAIHSALAYLLEHLPENLRLAIGSRADPPLPLARLRARGQLLEIRTTGLRFNTYETAFFLNEIMHLELSPDLVAILEARTEGWAAGLQLAALSLTERANKTDFIHSFTGSHRYLVEYLMEEVVNRQPEEVQAFLLQTSLLERLNAELCQAVIDERLWARVERDEGDSSPAAHAEAYLKVQPSSALDSQRILNDLDRANLFLIPLDEEQQWYRYHHLFRDFLRARLHKTRRGHVPALHRAACSWLTAHNFLHEAAQHALQSQDWEYAAGFVEQHSFTLIIHSDIATIYEWCSAFPEEVMQKHPMLCILQSLALAYGFQRKNRDRVEARLKQVDRWIAVMEDKQSARGLIDFASVVRTFLAMVPDPAADPRELLDLAQGMLEAYPEGNGGQFSGLLLTGYAYAALHEVQAAEHAYETARQIALGEGLFFGVVESTFHLARLAHSQGQLHRAAEICRQGQADILTRLSHPEQQLPAFGSFDIELGCVLLEQDQLDEAEQHLLHGLDLMGGGMNPYYLMTAYVALFRLCEIQGRPAEARKYLERLEAAWPDTAFCTRGLQVGLNLRTSPDDPDTLAEAAAWCRDFSSSLGENGNLPGLGPFGAAEAYYLAYLAWVRAQIATGSARAVMPYITRQLELASAHQLMNRVIELSLLEAQAWGAEGEEQRLWAALERALAAAQPAGYVRIFDQGPALTQLLGEAAQRGIFKEYLERILAGLDSPKAHDLRREGSAVPSAETPYGESLSDRELEVLHLIAQGATNQKIAEQLVITVGTVKSHINHILGKLEAHNRTEAVRRARDWGLLDL